MRFRRNMNDDREAYLDTVVGETMPGARRRGPRRRGRRLLRAHRLQRRGSRAGLRRGPAPRTAGQAARRPIVRTAAARRSRPSSAPFPPTISNIPTKPASRPWRRPASSRSCCRAPSIPCASVRRRRSRSFAGIGVPIAVATDSNPGTSPLTSILLALNMAATLFGLTVEECIRGVTRHAARGARARRRDRDARSGQMGGSGDLGRRTAGRTRLSSGLQSACTPASGEADERDRCGRAKQSSATGARSGAGRRSRSTPHAGRKSRQARRRSSASSPAASRSTESTPASASSPACGSTTADLAQLQRNIVLSHAAGVGEATPVPVTRLMMALKLGSLAQGASGVRPETIDGHRGDARSRRDAGRSLAGLGRRVGRPRAARPHGRRHDRRGRGIARRSDPAGGRSARRRRARAARAAAEGGARAPQRHAVLDRARPRRPVRGGDPVPLGAGDRRAVARRRARLGRAVRPAHPRAAPPSRPAGDRRGLARPRRRQRDPRLPPPRRSEGAGSLLPALPAAGDGGRARPSPPRRSHARRRSQFRVRQSAHLRRRRRGAVGRQFSRRACRLRRRHHRAGAVRDRLARRAENRHAGRSGAQRPAGLPDAEPGPQLGLHARPGDGRRARLREQAARYSGERRFDPDLGQPGGSRLDGGPWRAAAFADGRERVRHRRHRMARGRAGLRLSRADALERAARGVTHAASARGSPSRRRSLLSPRHRSGDAARARRRDRRGGRRRISCRFWTRRDERQTSGLARDQTRQGAADRQHSAWRRRTAGL